MSTSKFAKVIAIGLALALMPSAQAADGATVAWLRDGKVEVRALATIEVNSDTPADKTLPKVPLGSLWKLFVFSYLTQTHAVEPAYVCTATGNMQSSEERYCCDPGESITRGPALARSCAPYFSAERLGITPNTWRTHWQARSNAPWLLDIRQLKPETEVDVIELLQALAAIPVAARAEARAALLQTGTEGYGRAAWPSLGSGIRYKTYSWHRADGSAFGGAAGWLVDGTPFWFGGRGSSKTALADWATQLAATLPPPRWHDVTSATGDASCVDVDFFARYLLRAVWQGNSRTAAKAGDMQGAYRLEFANGNWLRIVTHGELSVAIDANDALHVPTINGRLTINDYVARVIDREGSANPTQAARALAIAARSYLFQNAQFESGCWHIADSSQTQRVSPNTPTDAALAAAWFTDDMVMTGVAVHYHNDLAAPNRLVWREAVSHADADWNFERILSSAFPHAEIATVDGHAECRRLDAAETWLTHAIANWRTRLDREPGFEALPQPPSICALNDGHPYSDQRRLRIFVRGWRSLDERLTLAHEYLHLALRFHPNGADETYIERLARQLIEQS
ncbi:MAG TPA: DUF2300 domain-containing protein [Burkholderiaceae bacterium]|nr:DUF2300 domain-containing protein [Burkholderiaceae bacterium]